MPAYHSQLKCNGQMVGDMGLMPLRTKYRGPAPSIAGGSDIVDDAILYFKANIFFKTYEVKGPEDRTLIYATLYITECLKVLQKCPNKDSGLKALYTQALKNYPMPGDSSFPLKGMFKPPSPGPEQEKMKNFLLQLRQEIGVRMADIVYATDDKPSKWWMCFAKRKFMDKVLKAPM